MVPLSSRAPYPCTYTSCERACARACGWGSKCVHVGGWLARGGRNANAVPLSSKPLTSALKQPRRKQGKRASKQHDKKHWHPARPQLPSHRGGLQPHAAQAHPLQRHSVISGTCGDGVGVRGARAKCNVRHPGSKKVQHALLVVASATSTFCPPHAPQLCCMLARSRCACTHMCTHTHAHMHVRTHLGAVGCTAAPLHGGTL